MTPSEERGRRAAVREVLRKASVLRMSEDELVHRGIFIRRDAGEAFVLPGDICDVLLIVGCGAVMTTVPRPVDIASRGGVEQLIVQIATPGQVVALGPLGSTHGPVLFGVTALKASTVVGLSRDFLIDVLRRQAPEVKLLSVANQTRAVARMLHDVCQLLHAPLRRRLVLRLSRICRVFPAPDDPLSINEALSLNQTQIGELVGATRGPVNKAMAAMVEAGVLRNCLPHIRFAAPRTFSPRQTGMVPSPVRTPYPLDDEVLRGTLAAVLDQDRQRMQLSRAAVAVLRRRAELCRYEPGESIALADDLFATLLVSGVARVDCMTDGRRVGVWMARPGRFVGAGWVGNRGSVPQFRATAHGRCIVARLRPGAMIEALEMLDGDQLLDFHGSCHAALYGHLHDKYRLLCLKAHDALLCQLRVFAEAFPQDHPRGTIIGLDLTERRLVAPRMIGDFVGIVPTTAAKTFASLLDEGLVEFVDGRILLPGFWPTGPRRRLRSGIRESHSTLGRDEGFSLT